MLGQEPLGILHRLADDLGALADAIGTQLELMPGCASAAGNFLAAVLFFVLLACRFKIDAEQGWAYQCDDHGRTDRAEDVGNSVRNRHGVEQICGLLWRQAKAIDGIGRKTHGRGNRLGASVEACRRADIIPSHSGCEIGAEQAEHAHDDREQRLRQSVLGYAADELRAHRIANGKQEHQEEEGLERASNRDPELADDHGSDQCRRYRPKAQAFVGERAEIISEGQGKEKSRSPDIGEAYSQTIQTSLPLLRDGGVVNFKGLDKPSRLLQRACLLGSLCRC